METQDQGRTGTSAKKTNNFDYSKGEATVQNITIPGSEFHAKWIKDEGYAIGIENIKITKYHKTLEEALNEIGYGVDKDEEGEEILVKVGEVNYEIIVRTMRALLVTNELNKEEYV